jgi:poly-gamma-glutamate synthesis protein (capsule biosynthesis protein)
VRLLDSPILAEVLLDLRPASQALAPLAERVFAAAVPFATLRDDIGFAELAAAWQGAAGSPTGVHQPGEPGVVASSVGRLWRDTDAADVRLAALENDPGLLAVLPSTSSIRVSKR